MANEIRKITLTSTGGGSGPNYKVEWSTDGINYSESIDCGNISLPTTGSFVTCSIDDAANFIRLTSLNIFCSNSIVETQQCYFDFTSSVVDIQGYCWNIVNTTNSSGEYSYLNINGIVSSGSLEPSGSVVVCLSTGSASPTTPEGWYESPIGGYCNQTTTCSTPYYYKVRRRFCPDCVGSDTLLNLVSPTPLNIGSVYYTPNNGNRFLIVSQYQIVSRFDTPTWVFSNQIPYYELDSCTQYC